MRMLSLLIGTWIASTVALAENQPTVRISVDRDTVRMGRSVAVKAEVTTEDGATKDEALLLPYVNGKRWGSHEWTDEQGRARFILPMPNPGMMSITVALSPIQADDFDALHGSDLKELLITGRIRPKNAIASDPVTLEVERWELPDRRDKDTLFGMQWEPWFAPGVAFWHRAQAVPILGFYESYNHDVMRQHILWFAELGVDFVMPDWSNHIWGAEHWHERRNGTNIIIHNTGLFLEQLASMRDEGIPVPKMVLMPGLTNGPPATMQALNEQLFWIHDAWVRNPRYKDLWIEWEGKPLIVVLDTAAVAHPDAKTAPVFTIPFIRQTLGTSEDTLDAMRNEMANTVDDSHFTVRWMSTQLQITGHDAFGYWTWMDGTLDPVVTYRDGKAEAITVTPAFFAAHGWRGQGAKGRRNGATYLDTFRTALEHRPKVVLLHQFNEFIGQPTGRGYGPDRDIYVDSYSVELSDDLEPVSLTSPGYRGDEGGWGFYYLNLTRALMDICRGNAPEDTLLALAKPDPQAVVESSTLDVEWMWAGKQPEGFTVLLDGRPVADGVTEHSYSVSLGGLEPGTHTLAVVADGGTTRYPLSAVQLDEAGEPQPTRVEVTFTYAP